MSISDTSDELFTLRNQARPLGYYVGEHRNYDPCRGGGPFWLMYAKSNPLYDAHQNNPTILKYATPEQIEEFLREEVENYAN
jgi:hypothetical protein